YTSWFCCDLSYSYLLSFPTRRSSDLIILPRLGVIFVPCSQMCAQRSRDAVRSGLLRLVLHRSNGDSLILLNRLPRCVRPVRLVVRNGGRAEIHLLSR